MYTDEIIDGHLKERWGTAGQPAGDALGLDARVGDSHGLGVGLQHGVPELRHDELVVLGAVRSCVRGQVRK